jgi:hypothetical protein
VFSKSLAFLKPYGESFKQRGNIAMMRKILSLIIVTASILGDAMEIELEPTIIYKGEKISAKHLRLSKNADDWQIKAPKTTLDLGCRLFYRSESPKTLTFNLEETLCSTKNGLGTAYNGLWYGFKYLTRGEIELKDYELLGMLAIAADVSYAATTTQSSITDVWWVNFTWLDHSLLNPASIISEFKAAYPECKRIYLSAPSLSISSKIPEGKIGGNLISLLNAAGIEVRSLFMNNQVKIINTMYEAKRHGGSAEKQDSHLLMEF